MSASTLPLFGRAYSLQVLPPADASGTQTLVTYTTDAWEPEALRITFDVVKQFFAVGWYASIAIYNLSADAEQNAIQVGSQVTLTAGYQIGSNSGVIFSGQVLQPTWTKTNGTDYCVTLRCIIGQNYLNGNLVSANIGRLSSQADFVRRMAAQAHTPVQTDLIDFAALSQHQLPRGQVIFGDVGTFLHEAATDNNAQFWVAGDRPAYAKMPTDISSVTPDVIYAPPIPAGSSRQEQAGVTYSIIGTPQQTQDGVAFRVLLDARMDFRRSKHTCVKIDQSQIEQLPLSIGKQPSAPFEQSGQYYVSGIRHFGDSRRNDWYTDLECITPNALSLRITG